MRRPFLSIKSIYFIFFAGLFSLFSFFFDQQVIQKEGDVREIETSILQLESQRSDESMKEDAFLGMTQRVLLKLNEHHMNSTLAYKFIILVQTDLDDEISWDGLERDGLGETYSYQFVTRLFNLSYYISSLKNQLTTYTYDLDEIIDELLINRIIELNEKDDASYDEYIELVNNDEILSVEEANDLFSYYFEELNELELLFNLIVDLSMTFSEMVIETEEVINEKYSQLENELISKNYFILVSILMQILSLLFLLLLFRTIIKNILDNNT